MAIGIKRNQKDNGYLQSTTDASRKIIIKQKVIPRNATQQYTSGQKRNLLGNLNQPPPITTNTDPAKSYKKTQIQ